MEADTPHSLWVHRARGLATDQFGQRRSAEVHIPVADIDHRGRHLNLGTLSIKQLYFRQTNGIGVAPGRENAEYQVREVALLRERELAFPSGAERHC